MSEEPLELDALLRNLAYSLERSDADVTWLFVKRGLDHMIEDLKEKLLDPSLSNKRQALEEDIAKVEEFIRVHNQ
jgi:hypothetical protein